MTGFQPNPGTGIRGGDKVAKKVFRSNKYLMRRNNHVERKSMFCKWCGKRKG